MDRIVDSKIVAAYSLCPRKAFLLLCTNEKGSPHQYEVILQQRMQTNQNHHIELLRRKTGDIQPYAADKLNDRSQFLTHVILTAEGLKADCGILTRADGRSVLGSYHYEPINFVGSHRIRSEQKLELIFTAHVLSQIQNRLPSTGRIITMEGKSHRVKLGNSSNMLLPILEPLQEWVSTSSPEPPPVILNKHCSVCQFRDLCKAHAEQEDNLSLLDHVTPKIIRKYEKKGIFTVKQLSYLFKPRRQKKRAKKHAVTHKLELQALAIRTGKIYLQELPELSRQPVELFLDIEGIPDQQAYYLIGLLVCEDNRNTYHAFWADTLQDEAQIWRQFLEKVSQYPDAPIYHYGSYEPKAIAKLSKRYETENESLQDRLVNINTYIYGRVYFPVRSNSLKEIGGYIGATWTSPDASGLQSLVWRHYWEETQDEKFKGLLVTYNQEDCRAVRLLADELTRIKDSADILSEVDFADQPKQYATDAGQEIHTQFKAILRFAHSDYDKKKITFRPSKVQDSKTSVEKERKAKRKTKSKTTKLIKVPHRDTCPKCKTPLRLTETLATSKRLVIDLVSMRTGLRKTVVKYVGLRTYCPNCHRNYIPAELSELGGPKLYGHVFRAWCIYLRVALRMPYSSIVEMIEEQFNEKISEAVIPNFIRDTASYYAETEKIIIQRLLGGPSIHADETTINIRGTDQYTWVFTDGEHVLLRLTETREATIVHDFLADYSGTLISDFYPGYDAVSCRQQKCWVHLIRDINNDLWKAPYDTEFEAFVLEVRNLIIPIMEAVQKYGLKKRNLNKFKKQVDRFYKNMITDKHYKSELTQRYQNRFIRYRESLFTFLDYDGIPWQNNAAERALRYLIVQEKISGFFYATLMPDYLRLLGIRQTCRFQGKSFWRFLMSREQDIDAFK